MKYSLEIYAQRIIYQVALETTIMTYKRLYILEGVFLMKIEHVAIWVIDLEKMKGFYESYFNGQSNDKYYNPVRKFESYFLTFESGARLEIMRQVGIDQEPRHNQTGWAHLAFTLGSKKAVDELTAKLNEEGYPILNGPRTTGDGYYESVIEDPEGNLVELMA